MSTQMGNPNKRVVMTYPACAQKTSDKIDVQEQNAGLHTPIIKPVLCFLHNEKV